MSFFDKKSKDPTSKDAKHEFDRDNLDSELDDLLNDNFDYQSDEDIVDPDKRHPIIKKLRDVGIDVDAIKSNALEGAGEGIKNAIDKSMPNVSRTWEGGQNLLSELDTLKTESLDKIIPAYNATMRSAKRMATSLAGRLPFKLDKKIAALIDKIHEPDEGGYEPKSKDQIREESQKNAMAAIFQAEQQERVEDKREATIEKTFDRRIGQIHHQETASILNVIRNQSVFQTAFTRGTFTAYLKKDLELKYKQLYATQDLLESHKLMVKSFQERLDAIRKNTALPDVDKITSTELIKKKVKEGLLNTVGNKLGSYFGDMRKNIMERYVKPFISQMEMGTTAMDMLGGNMDMMLGKAPEEFQWSDVGRMGLNFGVKKVFSGFTKQLTNKMLDSLDPATRAKVEGYLSLGENGIKLLTNDYAAGRIGDPDKLSGLKDFLANITPDLRQSDEISTSNYADLDKGGKLSNRTILTIEKIIPAYLRSQTKYLEILATGNTNAEEQVWDFKKNQLTTTSAYVESVQKELAGSRNTLLYERQGNLNSARDLLETNFKKQNAALYKEMDKQLANYADGITAVMGGMAASNYAIDHGGDEILLDFQRIKSSLEAENTDYEDNALFKAAYGNVKPDKVLNVTEWFIKLLTDPKTNELNKGMALQLRNKINEISINSTNREANVMLATMTDQDASIYKKTNVIHTDAYGNTYIDRNKVNNLREQYNGSLTAKEIAGSALNTKAQIRQEAYNRMSAADQAKEDRAIRRVENFLDTDEGKEALKKFLTEDRAGKKIFKEYQRNNPGKTIEEAIKDNDPDLLNEVKYAPGMRAKAAAGKAGSIFEKIGKFFGAEGLENIGAAAADKAYDVAMSNALKVINKFGKSLGDIRSVFVDENGHVRKLDSIDETVITNWLMSVPDKVKFLQLVESNRELQIVIDQMPDFAWEAINYLKANPDEFDNLSSDEAGIDKLSNNIENFENNEQNKIAQDFTQTTKSKSLRNLNRSYRKANVRAPKGPKPSGRNGNTQPNGGLNTAAFNNLVTLTQTQNATVDFIKSDVSKIAALLDQHFRGNGGAGGTQPNGNGPNGPSGSPTPIDLSTLSGSLNIDNVDMRTGIGNLDKSVSKMLDLMKHNADTLDNLYKTAEKITTDHKSSSRERGRSNNKAMLSVVKAIAADVVEIKENTGKSASGIEGILTFFLPRAAASVGSVLKKGLFNTIFVQPLAAAIKGSVAGLTFALNNATSMIYTLFTGKKLKKGFGELGSKLGSAGHNIVDLGGSMISSVIKFAKNIHPFEKVTKVASTVFNDAAGQVAQTYSGLTRAYDDVYSSRQQDKSKPLVSGEAFRDGLVVDAKGHKVRTVYDIKGPCYQWDKENNRIGNMLISSEDITEGDGLIFADGKPIKSSFLSRFASKVRRVGTIATNAIFGLPGLIGRTLKNAWKLTGWLFKKRDPFIDVYIIDKDTAEFKKVINGKDLVNNKTTRKYVVKGFGPGDWVPVKSAYGIEKEVYEFKDGSYQVIIDDDDLKNGLYDANGNRLTRWRGASIAGKAAQVAGKAMRIAGSLALKGVKLAGKAIKGAAGKVMKLFRGGLNILGESGTAVGKFITSAFSSVVSTLTGFGITRNDLIDIIGDRLIDIYELLDARMPGGSVAGDNDGSGYRDGSYRDYQKRKEEERKKRKQKQEEQEKKKNKDKAEMAADGEPNDGPEEADENNSSGEGGSSIWDWMMAASGISALKDTAGGWWEKKKQNGLRRARIARRRAGRRLRSMGRAAGRGIRGGARMMGRAAGTMLGGVGRAAGAVLGGAGRAAGTVLGAGARGVLGLAGGALRLGGGLLGLTGRVAAGLLSGPIGWALTLGTVGYYTYKLASDSGTTKLFRIPRAKAYGLTTKQWKAFEDLETDTYNAWKNGQEGVDNDRLEQFGEKIDFIGGMGYFDTGDDDSEANKIEFLTQWYRARFLPAYKDYVKIICQVTNNDGKKQPKADDVDASKAYAVKQALDKALEKYASGPASKLVPNKQCFIEWLADRRKDKNFRKKEEQRNRNKEFSKSNFSRAGKDFSYGWNELKHGNLLNATYAFGKGIRDSIFGLFGSIADMAKDFYSEDVSSYDQAWREAKLVAYNFKKKEAAINRNKEVGIPFGPIGIAFDLTRSLVTGITTTDKIEFLDNLEDKARPIVDQERPDLDRTELTELADELIPDEEIKASAKKFGGNTKEVEDAKVDYISTWWNRIFMPIFTMYLRALRAVTKTDIGDKPHLNSVPKEIRAQTIDAFKKGASDYKSKNKLFDLIPTAKGYAEWYMAIDKTAIDSATTVRRSKSVGEKVTEAFQGTGHQFGEAWDKLWEGDFKGSWRSLTKGTKKLLTGIGKSITGIGESIGDYFYGRGSNTVEKNSWRELRYKYYNYPNATIGVEDPTTKARLAAIEELEKKALATVEEGEDAANNLINTGLDDKVLEKFGITIGFIRPKKGIANSRGRRGNVRAQVDYSDKDNKWAKDFIRYWVEHVFLPVYKDYVTIVSIYTEREPGDNVNPDDIKKEEREEAMEYFKKAASPKAAKYKDYPMSSKGYVKFIKELLAYEKATAEGKGNAPVTSAVSATLAANSEKNKNEVTNRINSVTTGMGKDGDKGVAEATTKAASTLDQDIAIVTRSSGSNPKSMAAYLGVPDAEDKKIPAKWKNILTAGSIKTQFFQARLRSYSNVLGTPPGVYLGDTFKDNLEGKWFRAFRDLFDKVTSGRNAQDSLEKSLFDYQNNGASSTFAENVSKLAAFTFFQLGNPDAVRIAASKWEHPSWMDPDGNRTNPDISKNIDDCIQYINNDLKKMGRKTEDDVAVADWLESVVDKLNKWANIVREWVSWVINPVFAYYTSFVNKLTGHDDTVMPDPTAIPAAQRRNALIMFLTRAEKICSSASRPYLRDFNLGTGLFNIPVAQIMEAYDKFTAKDNTANNIGTKGSIKRNGAPGSDKNTNKDNDKSKDNAAEPANNEGAAGKSGSTQSGTQSPNANGTGANPEQTMSDLAKQSYKYDPKDIPTSAEAFKYFARIYNSDRNQLTADIISLVDKEAKAIDDYWSSKGIEYSEAALTKWFDDKKAAAEKTADHKAMANGGVIDWLRGGVVKGRTDIGNVTVGEAGAETVLPHKGGGRFNQLLTNAIRSTYGARTASAVDDILNGKRTIKALLRDGLDDRGLRGITLSPTDLILYNLYKKFFPKPSEVLAGSANGDKTETEDSTVNDTWLDKLKRGDVAGAIKDKATEIYEGTTSKIAHAAGRIFGKDTEAVIAKENKARVAAQAAVSDDSTLKLGARIWKYFTSHGWSESAVAGLLGNLQKESGVECIRVQNDVSRDRKKSIDYTNSVGSVRDQFIKDSKGYGLAQWTTSNRKAGLWDLAVSRGKSVGDADVQIEFLFTEFERGTPADKEPGSKLCNVIGKNSLAQLKKSQDVQEATWIVLSQFEKPYVILHGKEEAKAAELQERYTNAVAWFTRLSKGKVNAIKTEDMPEIQTDDNTRDAAGGVSYKTSADISASDNAPSSVAGAVSGITGSGQPSVSYTNGQGGAGVGILKEENLQLSSADLPADAADALNKLRGLRTMKGSTTIYGGGGWKSVAQLTPELIKRLYIAGKLYEDDKGDKARGWTITSAYRSYQDQARIHARQPGNSALPGRSAHESHYAVDLGDANGGGVMGKGYNVRNTVADELEPYLNAVGITRVYKPKHNEEQHFELKRSGLPDISKFINTANAKSAITESKQEINKEPKTDSSPTDSKEDAAVKAANSTGKDTSIAEPEVASAATGVTYPDSYSGETKQLVADRAAANAAADAAATTSTTTDTATQQIQSNAPKITTTSVANNVAEVNNGSAGMLTALNYQSTILEAIKNSVTNICKTMQPGDTKNNNSSSTTVTKPATNSNDLANVIVNAMREGFAAMSEQLAQVLKANTLTTSTGNTSMQPTTRKVQIKEFPVNTAKTKQHR